MEGIYVANSWVPNGLEAKIRGTTDTAGLLMHCLHFQAPGVVPSFADCLAVATFIDAWVGSNYRNMWRTGITQRDVTVTGISGPNGFQARVSNVHDGGRAGFDIPNSVSLFINFSTRQSGATRAGGIAGWPPVEQDVNGDHFTSAYVNAMVGTWRNLAAAAATAGYPLCIFSEEDLALYPVQDITAIDDIVDSRRRRLLGRGQ